MRTRVCSLSILIAIMLLAAAAETGRSQACECCASSLTWERYNQPLSAHQRAEVSRIPAFDGFLEGFASATRIEVDLLGETDRLQQSAEQLSNLVTETVSVFKPKWSAPAEFFNTFTGRPLPSPNVDVYKELVIEGVLELSSELAAELGVAEVEATLVLKGKGDHCWKIRDYWYWLLRFSAASGGDVRQFGATGELVKL